MANPTRVVQEGEPPKQVEPIYEQSEYITVSRVHAVSGQTVKKDDETQTLEVRRFLVAPAEVSFEVGCVVNLGDYETVRTTVGVRLPCYREEVDDTYATAKEFATTRLVSERKDIVDWARDVKGAKNLF